MERALLSHLFGLVVSWSISQIFFKLVAGKQSFLCANVLDNRHGVDRTPRSASESGRPSARNAVIVEDDESPAPVRSTGGAGSGYIGTNQVPSLLPPNAPFGPSVITTWFGPCSRIIAINLGDVVLFGIQDEPCFCLLQKKISDALYTCFSLSSPSFIWKVPGWKASFTLASLRSRRFLYEREANSRRGMRGRAT